MGFPNSPPSAVAVGGLDGEAALTGDEDNGELRAGAAEKRLRPRADAEGLLPPEEPKVVIPKAELDCAVCNARGVAEGDAD